MITNVNFNLFYQRTKHGELMTAHLDASLVLCGSNFWNLFHTTHDSAAVFDSSKDTIGWFLVNTGTHTVISTCSLQVDAVALLTRRRYMTWHRFFVALDPSTGKLRQKLAMKSRKNIPRSDQEARRPWHVSSRGVRCYRPHLGVVSQTNLYVVHPRCTMDCNKN